MIRSIDHIVILVRDLEVAIADYTELGFTVVPGGAHPGGATHNALVAFADGAYLELIAFTEPAQQHRWWQLGQRGGAGLVDYAVLPASIAQDVADARGRGLALEGPSPGGRVRPDGQQVAWQTARAATSDVPFLCGDRTPRALRVPDGAAQQHANGALGVAGITVAVENLDASVARYQALLGEPFVAAPAVAPGLGVHTAAAYLGGARITLAAPSDAHGPAGAAVREHLAQRGEGPYAVALTVGPAARTGALDPRQAHGARLELVRASASTLRARVA